MQSSIRKGQGMSDIYEIRFWNIADENIMVGGKYSHSFNTEKDAWNGANALLLSAYKKGAVLMDMNNVFYPIVED